MGSNYYLQTSEVNPCLLKEFNFGNIPIYNYDSKPQTGNMQGSINTPARLIKNRKMRRRVTHISSQNHSNFQDMQKATIDTILNPPGSLKKLCKFLNSQEWFKFFV